MSKTVIRIEGLSKRYQIGIRKHRYDTLRDRLASGFKALFHVNGRSSPANHRENVFLGS